MGCWKRVSGAAYTSSQWRLEETARNLRFCKVYCRRGIMHVLNLTATWSKQGFALTLNL